MKMLEITIDDIIRNENGGCHPMLDDALVIKARCNEGIVEVFVVGKWRPILSCRKTTTSIIDPSRVARMRRIVWMNTGWSRSAKIGTKTMDFDWITA